MGMTSQQRRAFTKGQLGRMKAAATRTMLGLGHQPLPWEVDPLKPRDVAAASTLCRSCHATCFLDPDALEARGAALVERCGSITPRDAEGTPPAADGPDLNT